MITLKNDVLEISFPEIHASATCTISFQRTLRIPDDNREYPLPAGLGEFPLFHVDDFLGNIPQSWVEHGGVFLPIYQSEAMWINFDSPGGYPFAVKIAAGKINAVTGETWSNSLSHNEQDYVVIPKQPWLDGFCIREGLIRQFVAMPLGEGFSAESQISGKEEYGGLQLVVYPMKREFYDRLNSVWRMSYDDMSIEIDARSPDMGLAPGGLMRQEIYEDTYGTEAWDQSVMSRCFVHLTNSLGFHSITGSKPPTKPITAQQYEMHGIPWFSYWDAEHEALKGSLKLAELDSVSSRKIKTGAGVREPTMNISSEAVSELGPGRVREGQF